MVKPKTPAPDDFSSTCGARPLCRAPREFTALFHAEIFLLEAAQSLEPSVVLSGFASVCGFSVRGCRVVFFCFFKIMYIHKLLEVNF